MKPAGEGFEGRVRASFARQGIMATLAAEILSVEAGRVVIAAPIRPETGQQHGFAHAGLGWTIGDSAAGYSALSLLPDGWEVLTAEMKTNLLAPAAGVRLIAEGRVVRAGKRLMVVASEVRAEAADGMLRHVATMLGTMVPLPPEGGA